MVRRFLDKQIETALKDTPVIMITGARQTGKTTFCQQLIKEGIFSGEYITLDDPAALMAAKSDPMGFLLGLGEDFIVDEVQRAPELFLSLKKIIDENKNRRVILTGSAEVMLQPKVADSLAGRLETHRLWPFSVDEIIGVRSQFLPNLLSEKSSFTSKAGTWEDILHLIKRGGYPAVVARTTDIRRAKWIQSYLESILQKDIRDLANIDGLSFIPKILNLLSVRVGSTINMSDLARLSGVKNSSFQRYMALLEQIFLIVKIQAWTPNAEGQFVKSPKIFLNDTGLLCQLANQNENIYYDRSQAGHLLENFLVMEIVKQAGWMEEPLRVMHFSMHRGAEVDLVIEDYRKHIYGIEIKAKASIQEKDFQGLKKLEQLAGNRFKKGIVLYTGSYTLGGFGSKNLWAVPIKNVWD
ncbi:MAG: ATP-binding protein [Bacteroidales bacterium]|jgi:predicted AAA+ superfamily ATPase